MYVPMTYPISFLSADHIFSWGFWWHYLLLSIFIVGKIRKVVFLPFTVNHFLLLIEFSKYEMVNREKTIRVGCLFSPVFWLITDRLSLKGNKSGHLFYVNIVADRIGMNNECLNWHVINYTVVTMIIRCYSDQEKFCYNFSFLMIVKYIVQMLFHRYLFVGYAIVVVLRRISRSWILSCSISFHWSSLCVTKLERQRWHILL